MIPHVFGNMAGQSAPNQQGHPCYEGYLNFRVGAMPELCKDVGCKTNLTGKWHFGRIEEVRSAAQSFDKSFALLEGGQG